VVVGDKEDPGEALETVPPFLYETFLYLRKTKEEFMENENTLRWTDNELDNSLFAEFAKVQPSESVIRELVKKGANVNAIDRNEYNIVISYAIDKLHLRDGLDIKYIKLLIELGADVNLLLTSGRNSFYEGLFLCEVDLFQLLLDAGLDPNCVTFNGETILDAIEDEEWICRDVEDDEKSGDILKEIGNLLIKYGAKRIAELYTDTIEKYLRINNRYPTGLRTHKGNIEPEKVIKDKMLVEKFKQWKNNHPEDNSPKEMQLEYNNKGYDIAKEIKSILGKDIVVEICGSHKYTVVEDRAMKFKYFLRSTAGLAYVFVDIRSFSKIYVISESLGDNITELLGGLVALLNQDKKTSDDDFEQEYSNEYAEILVENLIEKYLDENNNYKWAISAFSSIAKKEFKVNFIFSLNNEYKKINLKIIEIYAFGDKVTEECVFIGELEIDELLDNIIESCDNILAKYGIIGYYENFWHEFPILNFLALKNHRKKKLILDDFKEEFPEFSRYKIVKMHRTNLSGEIEYLSGV
jgi:hypothetical protein